MYRRNIVGISALVVGLAMVPGGAGAQQKSIKDQVVGTWTLLLADNIKDDGAQASRGRICSGHLGLAARASCLVDVKGGGGRDERGHLGGLRTQRRGFLRLRSHADVARFEIW